MSVSLLRCISRCAQQQRTIPAALLVSGDWSSKVCTQAVPGHAYSGALRATSQIRLFTPSRTVGLAASANAYETPEVSV